MEDIRATPSGKTFQARSVQTKVKILESSLKNSAKSKTALPLFLDLRKEDGKPQDLSWETNSLLLGEFSTRNFGESPKDVEESSLWQILEVEVPEKYYLSERACRGILRRAAKRGRELPPVLLMALISHGNVSMDEVAEMGISLQSVTGDHNNRVSDYSTIVVIGLDCYNQTSTDDKAMTLRAGHCDADGVPCVAFHLLQDPISSKERTPCLSTGNSKTGQASLGVVYSIDRAAFNQGQNAQYDMGIDDKGIAHTLVAKGPGAVCYPVSIHGDKSGTLDASYWKGCGERNGVEREIVAMPSNTKWTVRRLTPTECARLQGMPDWWCDGIKHSDSAEYKMWGNGMALPCVMYVMEGIANNLKKERVD